MPHEFRPPPGVAVLRAGTLVRRDLLDVVCHIWTGRKQLWVGIAEGVPTWPESAPPADFVAQVMLC